MRTIGIHGRGLVLGLASSSLILLTVAGVHAQDGGGSFFERLFGVAPQQAAPVQPRQNRQGPFDYGARSGGVQVRYENRHVRGDRRNARADRRYANDDRRYARDERAQKPKTRYVALPKADPEKITGKQPVDQKAILDNPTKAILNDKTLRAGDIVMLPGGPKVFTGGSEKRHQISEFQDVKNSQMVDRKTRQQLLAMMVPVGAMPADQARKVMAQTRAMKSKLAHPEEIAAVEASNGQADEPTPLRIIVPWKADR